MKDNAWFEGFAPRDNPEIVVVALFEHGEHGQFAAPIVRDVIKAYFDKKARISALRSSRTPSRLRCDPWPGLATDLAATAPAPPAGSPDQPARCSLLRRRRLPAVEGCPAGAVTWQRYLSARDIDWTCC